MTLAVVAAAVHGWLARCSRMAHSPEQKPSRLFFVLKWREEGLSIRDTGMNNTCIYIYIHVYIYIHESHDIWVKYYVSPTWLSLQSGQFRRIPLDTQLIGFGVMSGDVTIMITDYSNKMNTSL